MSENNKLITAKESEVSKNFGKAVSDVVEKMVKASNYYKKRIA